MGAILQHTRVALRGFARSPGLVTAVCLSLGLSAGANTTVVSGIESLVLDPYPRVADA